MTSVWNCFFKLNSIYQKWAFHGTYGEVLSSPRYARQTKKEMKSINCCSQYAGLLKWKLTRRFIVNHRKFFHLAIPQKPTQAIFISAQRGRCMRTCTGAPHPNFGFIIDGCNVEERHNLNQEHHLAHTATPILASLLMIRQNTELATQKGPQRKN